MTLIQPRGSTPGPWEVVGDPFDRSGCFVVGRNKLGGPAGDPHVCPEVARTDPLECYDCDEGNHPHDVHEADARLAACAPEFYALALQRVRSIARGYRADKDAHDEERGCTNGNAKWKPSIHMPRSACRLRLDVVSVTVERLQDVTEADALAEGTWIEHDCDTIHREEAYGVATFRCSWNTINAKRGYAWERNPLVWRIQFRRVVA